MQNNQTNHLVKDIHILNEQLISESSQEITLIVGDSISSKISTFTVDNPYKMDRITTFSISGHTDARLLPVKPLNSPRNIIKAIRNFLLNTYYSFCAPDKFNTAVLDLRCIEPNNMAHLVIHAIPLSLRVRNLAGSDTQFLFKKMAAPFEKLLNEFGINPITSNKKIQAEFVKMYATRHIAGPDIQLAGHDFVEASIDTGAFRLDFVLGDCPQPKAEFRVFDPVACPNGERSNGQHRIIIRHFGPEHGQAIWRERHAIGAADKLPIIE